MADWVKDNFTTIEARHLGDGLEARFASRSGGIADVGVSRFSYAPGARIPFGHRHRVQQEAYVVIAGSGHAKLGDEIVELRTWDVLRVAPRVIRGFEAGSEGLELICIGGPIPAGGDSERFDDFWQ